MEHSEKEKSILAFKTAVEEVNKAVQEINLEAKVEKALEILKIAEDKFNRVEVLEDEYKALKQISDGVWSTRYRAQYILDYLNID